MAIYTHYPGFTKFKNQISHFYAFDALLHKSFYAKVKMKKHSNYILMIKKQCMYLHPRHQGCIFESNY